MNNNEKTKGGRNQSFKYHQLTDKYFRRCMIDDILMVLVAKCKNFSL